MLLVYLLTYTNRLQTDPPSMRVVDDDGVVDGVAVARQAGDVPRLDLDRFAEGLRQVEVVRTRYFFYLRHVATHRQRAA